jgi:hypothetical protein
VIALAVVLGLASAAFVITDQSPSATPTGSVEPTATVQADDEIASEPRIAWESIPRGDERVAVLYAIKGEREALAVIGPDRRAHRCYTGRVLALGDFVGDVVLFTQEGDLYSIDAGCDRDPTLLVDAQSISAGGEYPSIYCPSFSPDGRHIVFSLLGQTGPLLWRVEADGTDPVALGPTPACGWIGQEHVLAFGWSTVDPYAVSIDPKRHARVLRDPHRWRAAVSADGTRIVRAPAGWADWQVEGGSGVSHIEPRVSWNCAGEGASGLTPDISWVENSSRRSVWHPSHPWFLYFDHRDRALVLDDGAQLLDEIELGSCSDYPGHSIAWFGNRALIRFEPHDVGTFGARAMEVYDFRTDGFETIPLRGKVERCCLEELLSVRSLVIPVPEDPFLPASELRPIVRPDLGFTMKLPTTWRIADCYQECRRWDGWREYHSRSSASRIAGIPREDREG